MTMNLLAYKHKTKGLYAVIRGKRAYFVMLDGRIIKEIPASGLRMTEFEDAEYEYSGDFLEALSEWETKQTKWSKFTKK